MRLPGLDDNPLPSPDAGQGSLERWCIAAGYQWVVGVDEAGRGPLAGPVTVAAFAFALEDVSTWSELDDSKRTGRRRREELAEWIRKSSSTWCVLHVASREVDRLNIRGATLHGMGRASETVCARLPRDESALVLVDGRDKVPQLRRSQLSAIKGDGRSHAIAGASILAKVARDAVMMELHQRWPLYGFARHKGYPVEYHRRAIADHGPSPAHRRSFRW